MNSNSIHFHHPFPAHLATHNCQQNLQLHYHNHRSLSPLLKYLIPSPLEGHLSSPAPFFFSSFPILSSSPPLLFLFFFLFFSSLYTHSFLTTPVTFLFLPILIYLPVLSSPNTAAHQATTVHPYTHRTKLQPIGVAASPCSTHHHSCTSCTVPPIHHRHLQSQATVQQSIIINSSNLQFQKLNSITNYSGVPRSIPSLSAAPALGF